MHTLMTYNLSADVLLLLQNINPSSYGLLTTVDCVFRQIEIVCNDILQQYENSAGFILKRINTLIYPLCVTTEVYNALFSCGLSTLSTA